MQVTFDCDARAPSGYSRASRAHMKALIEAGVDVIIEDRPHDMVTVPLDPWWEKEYAERSRRKDRTPIKIVHHTPDLCTPSPGQLTVAMVAWETSRIPDVDINGNPRYNWAKQLNKVDLVWTFCNSAKKAMVDCGVETRIDVIPHPIDPTTYYPTTRKAVFDSQKLVIHDDLFKFLSIFQWIPRKDPKALILAYLSEFTPDDDTVLMLKTYYMKAGDLDPIKKAIATLKREFRLPYEPPRIMLVPGVLTDTQMADLMRSADCMVTTTKAEGFGLPQAEGMACGVPSVAPAGSAFLDYIDDTNGYPVKVHEEPVHSVAHSPWYFASQNWHRIDVMDLRRQMRAAYEDRAGLEARSKASVDRMQDFHPTKVGQTMKDSLEQLLAQRL